MTVCRFERNRQPTPYLFQWGFNNFWKKRVIINARKAVSSFQAVTRIWLMTSCVSSKGKTK